MGEREDRRLQLPIVKFKKEGLLAGTRKSGRTAIERWLERKKRNVAIQRKDLCPTWGGVPVGEIIIITKSRELAKGGREKL